MPPHFLLRPSVGMLSDVVGAGAGGVDFATKPTLLDVVTEEAFGHGGAANVAETHGQHIQGACSCAQDGTKKPPQLRGLDRL